MIIDLHIHSKASDGKLTVQEIFEEAKNRNINFMAITDHDSISCQTTAIVKAKRERIRYITGVELNVTFTHPNYHEGKPVSLDFLGYQFGAADKSLESKLETMARYREERAAKILDNLNAEFEKENIPALTKDDLRQIEESVDGVLGRPHIADYLIKKGIVKTRQEAFDRYLVKCDVPKYPLYLEEASKLVRDAGGELVLAHPNDPHGTSLVTLTKSLVEQTAIIQEKMLPYIDGVECWHSRSTPETTNHYVAFAKEHGLIMTGGSDCHQKPIIMGTVYVPDWVADQFA
ncbi:MAG TPA: PHP domain-containing protein [Candidatus Limnocylindrales bacterium]|nr:PHP domain-containing protein [Candidatus Limnocylindrales bacterium]